MKKKIIVLGSGMVGSTMALDLAKDHEVTLTDIDAAVLNRIADRASLQKRTLDVQDKAALHQLLAQHDLAVCAVPGFLGFETLKSIIEAGSDVVDISFFPENALELDALAKEKGVTAIVDCGVAPGMGNVILGYYDTQLSIDTFECLVGGLPKVKTWPFCYKAPFSPIDVIEEYTRPARYVENGQLVVRPALSDCHYEEFEGVGTLEAFNSDGLRSLLFTMPHIPNMKEKTMRYPGHVEYIKVLQAAGFFDTNTITVKGQNIRPIDLTNQLLFKAWYLEPEEEELTVMKITIRGKDVQGDTQTIVYELHDTYDQASKTSSMARTTGYTATAASNLILNGLFQEKGIFPPELVGKHKACFQFILNYLEDRQVHYHKHS